MNQQIESYHQTQTANDRAICDLLYAEICFHLPGSEHKLWHGHPVWFLEGNPIVGYSKQKNGVRLMFWSGADFEEEQLKPGTGKFKDASVFYNAIDEVDLNDLQRWLSKAVDIQWDYKNLVRRKGVLELVIQK
ncbi:MAG: DUF1801 domain-containing protein [Saprospiraceae bacterium]|nr:DUF1801 domain-containing protein [Saprospiraceae bacterium]